MKRFFKLIPLISILLVFAMLFGCSAAAPDKGGVDMGAMYPDGYPSEDGMHGGTDTDTPVVTPGEEGGALRPQAGIITAAAHNDNIYYNDYKALFTKGQTVQEDGKFLNYVGKESWGLDSLNRIKVTVTKDGLPVANAPVTFSSGDTAIFKAKTDSAGVAYLFGNTDGGTITCQSGENTAEKAVTATDTEAELNLTDSVEKGKTIEIMFVVDVTGSMGDELSYLKSELADVIGRISNTFGDTKINLALLFYRDDCDDEKFAYSDFANVTLEEKLSFKQSFLDKQDATGGGDYEEAVDEALELAVSKQWSGNSTKIIFHLLDAPPHSKDVYRERYQKAIYSAAEKGIRICPVLASGADLLTEYLTRQAATITGGTFVFITDHSGVGGTHHDPNIASIVVEKLNDLMVRLVKGYYTGTFDRPVACNGKTYYNITAEGVEDGFIVSGIRQFYAVGATVTIYTEYDPTVCLYVDGNFAALGEKCRQESFGDEEVYLLKFTFTMPDTDVTITFEPVPENVEPDPQPDPQPVEPDPQPEA